MPGGAGARLPAPPPPDHPTAPPPAPRAETPLPPPPAARSPPSTPRGRPAGPARASFSHHPAPPPDARPSHSRLLAPLRRRSRAGAALTAGATMPTALPRRFPASQRHPLVAHESAAAIAAYRHGMPVTIAHFLHDVASTAAALPERGHILNI